MFSHNVIPSNSLHSLTKHIIREKSGNLEETAAEKMKKKKEDTEAKREPNKSNQVSEQIQL